ncbi:MAG: hypothetical protein N2Z74_06895 [Syntrophales bacterium]|nr:hypothetical protein [Syntrophales bacterium]
MVLINDTPLLLIFPWSRYVSDPGAIIKTGLVKKPWDGDNIVLKYRFSGAMERNHIIRKSKETTMRDIRVLTLWTDEGLNEEDAQRLRQKCEDLPIPLSLIHI